MIPNISINGDRDNKIPGIINFSIPGINNEYFVKLISDDISISTGSACALGEPSHVIQSLDTVTDYTYIRLSLNKYQSNSTSHLLEFINSVVDQLS